MSRSHLKYATFWQRLIAWLIDCALILIVFRIIALFIPNTKLIYILNPANAVTTSLPVLFPQAPQIIKVIILIQLVHLLTNYIYSTYFIHRWGQTIGKKIMGIQVISEATEKPPRLIPALIRETFAKFLSGLLLYLGYLAMLLSQKKQALHDHIAGTIVIQKE